MCVARGAMSRPLVVCVWCLTALAAARVAHAQQPLRIPPPAATAAALLTLEDAVREALDRNLSLEAERYSVSVARARIVTARLRPNPVLTISAMLPDQSVFNENISPREDVIRTDVVIEGGGKRDRRVEVAEAAQSVAELQFLNLMRTLVLNVQSAFVDVVRAKGNVALARESLDAFNSLVEVNTERVRTGDLAQVELARSRLAALQFQNDVRQQESKLAVALTQLKTIIGRSGPEAIDVTGDLRRDAQPVDLAAVRQHALTDRPDLAALRRDQARSAADIRLQIAQGQIDYTVSGEVHHQHQATPVTDNTGYLYGLFLSVPLPIFNRNQGEVERARLEERQAAARVRALEADVNQEVLAAYEAYTASRDIVNAIEGQMLVQARDVRTATEYSYRRGEASFVEFLDAVRAFNDTMQSYNEARADYARSLYTLDSISGASISATSPVKVMP